MGGTEVKLGLDDVERTRPKKCFAVASSCSNLTVFDFNLRRCNPQRISYKKFNTKQDKPK
jgi:hypothetical protein